MEVLIGASALDGIAKSLNVVTSTRVAVGIATKGRAPILCETISSLSRQSCSPDKIIISYTAQEDVLGIHSTQALTLLLTPAGLTMQRNYILDAAYDCDIVLFFDDDFLPTVRYIEAVIAAFASAPDVVAITGAVIADGATGQGIRFAAAQEILRHDVYDGAWPGLAPEWGCYGCNMAFRLSVIRCHAVRFDERLPLYGWWEDIDFSRRLARYGQVVRVQGARGVHLGVKAGRTSGLRFGYSQVANPFYMARKGSVSWRAAARMVGRHTLINLLRSIKPEIYVDRRGRLKGNLLAWFDVARGVVEPEKILQL